MIRSRSGMTLLELVIALVITGLMAGVGYSAFSGIIDNQQRVEQASVTTERAATLRETIHTWLESGTVTVQQGGLPRGFGRSGATLRTVSASGTAAVQSVTPAVVTGDVLSFTTQAPNPANAPQATMKLFVDDDPTTPEVGLTVEYQASAQSPLLRRQLEASIDTMVIEYLDDRTNRWYPAVDAATIRPKAVRITLHAPTWSEFAGLLSMPMVLRVGSTGGVGSMSRGGGR
jgi:prepilin-type N-terminal cleavage/methylation domain-containing protein